jgi:hypothetical protein
METYYEEVERLTAQRENEELQALVEKRVAELVSDGHEVNDPRATDMGKLVYYDDDGGKWSVVL